MHARVGDAQWLGIGQLPSLAQVLGHVGFQLPRKLHKNTVLLRKLASRQARVGSPGHKSLAYIVNLTHASSMT